MMDPEPALDRLTMNQPVVIGKIQALLNRDSCGHNDVRVSIRYWRSGEGDPILLLHGWGREIENFASLFEHLKTSFDVVAIDFPSHGESEDVPPGGWRVSDFVACVLSVMNQLGLQSATVVGHSFGGRIAIQLAAHSPERVDRMVLIDGAGVLPPGNLAFYRKYWLARTVEAVASCLPWLGSSLRIVAYRIIRLQHDQPDEDKRRHRRETYVKVVSEDLSPLLAKIRLPTLLIWGSEDEDTPPAAGREIHRIVEGSEFKLLEGAGHFAHNDQELLFRLYLEKFLAAPAPSLPISARGGEDPTAV